MDAWTAEDDETSVVSAIKSSARNNTNGMEASVVGMENRVMSFFAHAGEGEGVGVGVAGVIRSLCARPFILGEGKGKGNVGTWEEWG